MVSNETHQEQVKDLILQHRGSNNPISSRTINEEIDVDSIGSFPGTRAIIRELIIEDQLPIASSSNGYYLIESEDELAEYVDNLDSRMLSIADRKAAVLRAAQGWDGKIEISDDEDLL